MREYIVGCKDIVIARREELQEATPAERPAAEGVLASLSSYEPATEAVKMHAVKMHKEIRNSTEAKTANELYKQAKKLYGLGSKEQALTHLKKAQALYEKCLAQAEEHAKMFDAETTAKIHVGIASVSNTFNRKVTNNENLAYLIDYFEDRVDACKALELQWNNKAGKSSFKETKAQLKAERKEVKKQKREERKAAKAKAKEVPEEGAEEAMIDGMTTSEFVAAMESIVDDIEVELALEAALEAEGEGTEEEVSTKSASGLTARFRAAFGKLKKAKAEGNATDVDAAVKEITEAAKDLEEADKAAQTPEEKKKLSKAGKAALIAGSAVAAVVLTGAAAIGAKKYADKNPTATGAGGMIVKLVNAVRNAKAKHENRKAPRLTAGTVDGEVVDESVLTAMAFGMESFCVEDECDDDI